MRAASDNIHVSGAERILHESDLENMLGTLICHALSSCTPPDKVQINKIHINIDSIDPESICYIQSLDIKTILSPSCNHAEKTAKETLESSGINREVVNKAFHLLREGTTPEGNNMRGAVIMDIATGNRMEPDNRRGIRVSRIDYTEKARRFIKKGLQSRGIFHERVIDAVAIASKVCSRRETIAELCWSDNPEYTTGYVASGKSGYIRITNMKEKGSRRGGRIFFVDCPGQLPDDYIIYLETQPVIINKIGTIHVP